MKNKKFVFKNLFADIFSEERDIDILLQRINGKTLREVALQYGVGKEWVRQIESRCIKKIRNIIEEEYEAFVEIFFNKFGFLNTDEILYIHPDIEKIISYVLIKDGSIKDISHSNLFHSIYYSPSFNLDNLFDKFISGKTKFSKKELYELYKDTDFIDEETISTMISLNDFFVINDDIYIKKPKTDVVLEYVIKQYFDSRINVSVDLEKLVAILKSEFSIEISPKYLKNKIQETMVLYQPSVYIIPPQQNMNNFNDYFLSLIRKNRRISYESLYNQADESIINEYGILNPHHLHGLLSYGITLVEDHGIVLKKHYAYSASLNKKNATNNSGFLKPAIDYILDSQNSISLDSILRKFKLTKRDITTISRSENSIILDKDVVLNLKSVPYPSDFFTNLYNDVLSGPVEYSTIQEIYSIFIESEEECLLPVKTQINSTNSLYKYLSYNNRNPDIHFKKPHIYGKIPFEPTLSDLAKYIINNFDEEKSKNFINQKFPINAQNVKHKISLQKNKA